jgi:hypothetical protein
VLQVSYLTPQLRGSVSYRGSHQEIVLNRKRKIFAERYQGLGPLEIPAGEREAFLALLAAGEAGAPTVMSGSLPLIFDYERLAEGLFPMVGS